MSVAPDTLSLYERQSLINQYKLLEKSYPEMAETYSEYQKILRQGYSLQYEEIFETWPEKTNDECRYVYDIMDMYRILKASYGFLNPTDKATVSEADIRFQGFDGNNESERWGFVEHLKEQGKWQEILNDNCPLDSHSMHTIDLYPKMMERYEAIKQNRHPFNCRLTADEINQIVAD